MDGLDLDNPLVGRSIRFYPNVFGQNTKGVPVLDAIMGSDEATVVAAASDAESRRLAYVGMTRARDTIIVALPPTAAKAGAWILSFDCEHLLSNGDALALPEGDPIPSDTRDLATARFSSPDAILFAPAWFLERTPTKVPLRERQSPSEAEPIAEAAIGEIIDLGPRIAVHGDDMAGIGTALHAVIAAELVNPDRDDAAECAAAIIEGAADVGAVEPDDAVNCARRLAGALASSFSPSRVLAEYPVELAQSNGQVLWGWIDLLLETEAGWIVIDHKSSPRPRSEWAAEAIEYSGQLAAYAQVLEAAGVHCAGCWIHFPVTGGLVEVKLNGVDS